MANSTYPNLKQSFFLIFLFFLSFGIYFFLTLSIPQLFGLSISKFWKDIAYSLASPVATLPLIYYVSSKGGIKPLWPLKLPSIKIVLLLLLLSASVRFIASPLINPFEFFKSISDDKIRSLGLVTTQIDFGLVIGFIFTVFLVPIIEETFWRLQVLGMLLRRTTPVIAIFISSALFACAHLKFIEFGFLFIWGLIFGFIYYKTNSIVFSMILHFGAICSGYLTDFKFIKLSDTQLIFHIIISIACSILIVIIVKRIIKGNPTSISGCKKLT